ncbi:hypothetical protein [Sphingobacterium detergens]
MAKRIIIIKIGLASGLLIGKFELADNKFKTLVDIVKVLSYILKNEYQTIGQA